MAIQMRRGDYADFNPDKLVDGEMAFVTSGDTTTDTGTGVYVRFAAGNVQRLSTQTEVDREIQNAMLGSDLIRGYVSDKVADMVREDPTLTTTLDDDEVTTRKIENGAVTATKLGSNAVTNAKIYNGAVSMEKLASAVQTQITPVNNLTSTTSLQPLAAAQGKALKDSADALSGRVDALEGLGFGDVESLGSENTYGTLTARAWRFGKIVMCQIQGTPPAASASNEFVKGTWYSLLKVPVPASATLISGNAPYHSGHAQDDSTQTFVYGVKAVKGEGVTEYFLQLTPRSTALTKFINVMYFYFAEYADY